MGQSDCHDWRDARKISLCLLMMVFALVPPWATAQDSQIPSETAVKAYEDVDAYSIYAILLESEKHLQPVIQSETDSLPLITPEEMGIKGGREFRKVWAVVIKDYAKQYRTPRLLTRNIPTKIAYELVPRQKVDDLFKSEKKWLAFYEVYPSSGGYYSFSAVGFDPQKTHAIVYMNHSCGMLCGIGGPHFFEKQNGKWREVNVNAEVRVWAS